MMGLAERQAAFMAYIHDEDLPLPRGWNARHAAGMAIYRNNYRVALVDALLDTFARTARWVGEDAFRQAAAHHLILHPPTSWTLDDAGRGFDTTLAELFVNDPEVAELGWIEWAMHCAFGAEDAVPMTAGDFASATAGFGEADWGGLRLSFIPRLATRLVQHDVAAIWAVLADDTFTPPPYHLDTAMACHVYREGERPVFVTAPVYEVSAVKAALAGASFGDVCTLIADQLPPEEAAAEAGAMLSRWLNLGIVRYVNK